MIDSQTLGSIIEAINWYAHKRVATQTDLGDLKAFVLLTAVKNLHNDAVEWLLQGATWKDDRPRDRLEGGAPSVAVTMASLYLKQALNQQLLKSDLESDMKHRRKDTSLLSWAIQCGHLPLIELLAEHIPIQHHEDIDVATYKKATSLELACLSGHEAIAQLILAKRAHPYQIGEDEYLALNYASRNGHEDIVRLLLRHGARIGSKNKLKRTPLHEAAYYGHVNVMATLIDHGADIEARGNHGLTAILEAAKQCQEAAILLLLKAGANLLATDTTGMEARHWIVSSTSVGSVSNELVTTIYKRACEFMYPSMPCPRLTSKRRVDVEFSCDTWGTQLWLMSHHAYMEISPQNASSNYGLIERYKRYFKIFNIDQSSLSRVTVRFSIVHQEDFLDFAVPSRIFERLNLQIVGGGERSVVEWTDIDNTIMKWYGVEVNPDAEIVDSDEEEEKAEST